MRRGAGEVVLGAVVLAAALCVIDAPAAGQPTGGAAEAKETRLPVVITVLRREAKESWREAGAWPRSASDFAIEKNWRLPAGEVEQALSRKLDRNPAVDAYIKWQLLSFGSDLGSLDLRALNRVVEGAPEPLGQPVIREEWFGTSGNARGFMVHATQLAYIRDLDPVVGAGAAAFDPEVATVSSGTVLDAEARAEMRLTIIRRANDKLDRLRDSVNRMNEPIRAYRTALADAMPAERGIRLGVMLKDVRDRIVAGDPSTPEAIDRLVASAKTAAAEPTLDRAARMRLVGWCRTLATIHRDVAESVELTAGDGVKVNRHRVAMRAGDVELLVRYLDTGGGAAEEGPGPADSGEAN